MVRVRLGGHRAEPHPLGGAEVRLAANDPADLLELRPADPPEQLRTSLGWNVQPQADVHPHLREMPEAVRGSVGQGRAGMDGVEPGCGSVARLRHGLGPDEGVGTTEEPGDWTAAPHTWSGFAWEGIEPNRIPWAALKSAWRRTTPLTCLNCDQPTLLTNFGFPWSGMLNRRLLFIHTCGKCRRLFEDRSVGDVGKWIVKNLEAEVWPDYDMVWDRTRTWEPPRSGS